MQSDEIKISAELLNELSTLRQRNIELEELANRAEIDENLRAVSETALDAIIIIDQDGNIVFWNKRAAEIFGYEAHEVLGNSVKMLISDEAMGGYNAGREHVLERGVSSFGRGSKVSIAKRKNGAVFPAEFTVSNWKIGDKYYFGGSLRDVSEQKRLEEEYETILNMSQDLICIAGMDGFFKYMNPAGERLLGYAREELFTRPFLDFIHPEDHAKNDAAVERLSSGKILSDFENRYICKDGSIRNFSWTAAPLSEKGLIYCVGRDITERKRQEEALREREKRFRTIAESSIDAIINADSNGKILFWNKAAATMYGFTAEEIMGKSIELLRPKGKRLTDRKNREKFLKTGQSLYIGKTVEGEACKKDGTVFLTETSTSYWTMGGQTIFCGIVRDITERKQMEAELRKSRADLEKRVKQRTAELMRANEKLQISEEHLKNFAGMILSAREEERKNLSTTLHDELGSMAIAVDSQISIAKEECNQNNKKATFEALTKAQAALRASVADLRRIAVDLRPPNLEIMGLTAAITELLDKTRQQATFKIIFSNELGKKKIPEDRAIVIYRVIQEGLTNVMKHAKAKSVQINLHADKKNIWVEITDDGVGCNLDKVLYMKGKPKIGIAGMRERVESHGGEFTITSAPKKGTQIKASLPQKITFEIF